LFSQAAHLVSYFMSTQASLSGNVLEGVVAAALDSKIINHPMKQELMTFINP